MKTTIILSCFFLLSCAAPYVEQGQTKPAFNPNFDRSCIIDKSLSGGIDPGKVCAHENGIVFVRHKTGQFNITISELDRRAQDHCSFDDRKARYTGKPDMGFLGNIGYTGREYICS